MESKKDGTHGTIERRPFFMDTSKVVQWIASVGENYTYRRLILMLHTIQTI